MAALPSTPDVTVKPPPAPDNAWRGGAGQGLSYGALGLPLAFVALPLYVLLPNHYATAFGVPLTALGLLLLGARLLDAVADPWIGRWADGWFAHSFARVMGVAAVAAVVLVLGFRALFFPTVQGTAALLAWCGVMLAVTYLSYSVLTVMHQAWGARLGGDEAQRSRIVSWREGLALVGVLVASVVPSVAGLHVTTVAFGVLLVLGVALLWRAPRPATNAALAARGERPAAASSMRAPLRVGAFRRLLAVYLINGVASAIPATLVLFFIRDRLQAPAYEPLFLGAYFAAGALSMPLWVKLVARLGLARTWGLGMALSIVTFAWATALGAGDVAGFTAVCVASGLALGADLAVPSALLAGVVQRAGHSGSLEGAYFGWWNFATKLNLALAAGIALPALDLFGYTPGATDPQALQALTVAYCVLPCALKAAAGVLLYLQWIRPQADDTALPAASTPSTSSTPSTPTP
jgi:GPH family glycoside/pentoside/hexuronide:cation symporter